MASDGRRILIAVDESDESMHALRWSLENLRSNITRDTLVLLYVRPPPPICPALDGTGYIFSADALANVDRFGQEQALATVDRFGQEQAVKVMEKATAIYKDFENMKVEKHVVVGDARDVISEKVEKLGVDMLVMGSHGYGLIKRAFLGSVSDYCVKNVKCPVLIIKSPKP